MVALLAGLLFLVVQPVEAAPTFMGLGAPDKLTPNDVIANSTATAISADGSTVVGSARATIRNTSVFLDFVATRWTQADGQTFIELPPIAGAPANDFPRVAIDVSADGSVIVGRADGFRFFQFTEATGTIFFGNELRLQSINGISGDGSTIVGSASLAGANDFFAYRLTGTTLADLEQLANPAGGSYFRRTVRRQAIGGPNGRRPS